MTLRTFDSDEYFNGIPTQSLIASFIITVFLVTLYKWLLPKPISGIAYNPEAVKSLFGDAPSMIKEVKATGEFRVWCAKQVQYLNSPICQVFIRPFSKPWVLLAEFRESRVILMRRKEFDKSSFLADGMASIGAFHGIYPTGKVFKENRQLLQDLMTTSFLENHVGPAIHRKGLEVMKLFTIKMKLAKGRPFSVKKDFEYASLNIMLNFAFGQNWTHTAIGPQVQLLNNMNVSEVGDNESHERVEFPPVPLINFLDAVYEVPDIVEKTINAIIPKLQLWWWSKQSWYKEIFKEKERVMKEQVEIGVKNYLSGHVETEIEHMLMREGTRAEKDGRDPDFESVVFRDEVRSNV
jgi:hypothetical protein